MEITDIVQMPAQVQADLPDKPVEEKESTQNETSAIGQIPISPARKEESFEAETSEDGEEKGFSPEKEKVSRLLAAAEAREKMSEELENLFRILPDADLRKITPRGWELVREGESLLCTYLLCEREAQRAQAANERTAKNNSGALPTGEEDSYTVEEIRRMDRSAIRKNMDKVMRSLSFAGKKK